MKDASVKMRQRRRKMPHLPYEIFTIIAKFLAGSCAFGTLANLNVADRVMRMEILPILYETVLLDNVEKLEYYKEWTFTLPLGFKYTKFHFCAETPDEFRNSILQRSRAIMFPRLVMTVSVNRDTNTESDDYEPNLDDTACSLWLQKSIAAATAFGVILKTPVHHNRRTHEGCLPASSASCDAERRRPLVRPLESFKHFAAHPSARLLSTPCTVGDWTTCIRPRDLIVSFVPNTVGSGMTITELFMLTGRYRSTGCIEQRESDDAKHPDPDGSTMTPGRQRDVYIRWHLRLRMPWTEVGLFLLQYVKLAEVYPSILHNRITINFDELVHPEQMSTTMQILAAVFNKFTDKVDFGADWKPSDPPLVLFRLTTRFEFEDDLRIAMPGAFGVGASLLLDRGNAERKVSSNLVLFRWQ